MRPWPWQSVSGPHFHSPSISVKRVTLPPSRAFWPCSWPRPSVQPLHKTVRHCHRQPPRSVILAQGRPHSAHPHSRTGKDMFSPEHRSPSLLSSRTGSPYRRRVITVRSSPSEFGIPIDINALAAAPVSPPSSRVPPRKFRRTLTPVALEPVPEPCEQTYFQDSPCKNSTKKHPTPPQQETMTTMTSIPHPPVKCPTTPRVHPS